MLPSIQDAVIPWDGKMITTPGIYSGVPMPFYHSQCCDGPSLSSSNIRKAEARNMEHAFKDWSGNPAYVPPPDTDFFGFGRMVHDIAAGDETFRERFTVRPERWDSWRTKDAKEWRALRRLDGFTCLTPDQYVAAGSLIEKLHRHPVVQDGILRGLVEHSIFWKDEATGLWCKARPDVIPLADRMVADLKTTTDASLPMCVNAISKNGYHIQMAMIAEGLEVLGYPMEEFVLIFIESEDPHSINHKPLEDYAINFGRRQLRRTLDKWADALATGDWPGYEDDQVAVGLSENHRKALSRQSDDGSLPEIPGVDTDKVGRSR